MAAALMNYHRMTQPASDARILIAYFSVSRNSVSVAKGDIVDWVRELGYTKTAEQPVPAPGGANVLKECL